MKARITRPTCVTAAGVLLTWSLIVGAQPMEVRADTPTPTLVPVTEVVPTIVPTSSPTRTPAPTSTMLPTRTITPRIVTTAEAVPTKASKHRKKVHRRRATPRPTATATATPVIEPTHVPKRHRKKHSKHHTKPTATPTATVTPTSTPALNLTAEDSVAPVTCNGPARPSRRPFLDSPYHGFTSIVSFFDHASPNFVHDGLTIISTGVQATPDAAHHRTDFPAYWNPQLRQYLDYDGHNGYDYDISYQPVYAAAVGTVIFAGLEYPDSPDHGYGNMIMIDHHNGYVTLYGHLSKILVKVGHKVRRGHRIAISGNTGHSTGPHLHFTVFHNCTPTDPYGWAGSGPDPLADFKGESAVFLWRKVPSITNPVPDWPGIGSLPSVSGPRRLLLSLPRATGGVSDFEKALQSRGQSVLSALKVDGVAGRLDMLRGAVMVTDSLSASETYRLPYVVSIEAPDSVDGSRSQVLAALAAAAASTPAVAVPLDHSKTWTGSLVSLAGRTVLVGRGTKGREVALRLPSGNRKTGSTHIQADAQSGLYAVDLGKLTPTQYLAISREIRGSRITSVRSHHAGVKQRSTQFDPARRSSGSAAMLALPALVLAACGAAFLAWRRRRTAPPIEEHINE